MNDFTEAAAPQNENYQIFCDCEGTLFGLSNGEKINIELLEFLMEAQKSGYEVKIFSNDPAGSNFIARSAVLMLQAQNSNLAEFLKSVIIEHKDAYQGVVACMIFDNDHPSHQSISKNRLAPDDPKIPVMTARLKSGDTHLDRLIPKQDI